MLPTVKENLAPSVIESSKYLQTLQSRQLKMKEIYHKGSKKLQLLHVNDKIYFKKDFSSVWQPPR